MTKLTPRHLDHIVLPVPELDLARYRYSQLGFTVAPDGRHKFGSENACVFFENRTFIEPLAIGHRETVEAAIDKGNTFLRRDFGYRFRNGEDGFSCVVMGDPDPKFARKHFKKIGYETGKLVRVNRPGVDVSIAFILDERAPDISFFMCERPDGPTAFAKELITHDNGALGITNVALFEEVPSDFQYYLYTATNQREARSHSFGMEIETANGTINTLNEEGMEAFYGARNMPKRRGLIAAAFDIAVSDLGAVKLMMQKNQVACSMVGSRLVVAPAEGQGAYLAFVEQKQ